MLFALTWMDQDIIIQSQPEKYHLHMDSLKNGTNELIFKTGTDSETQGKKKKKKTLITKGKNWQDGLNQEFGVKYIDYYI